MRSRKTHWAVGSLIIVLSSVAYVVTADMIPLLPELVTGTVMLGGILLAISHPQGGSVKRKVAVIRILLILVGCGFFIAGIYAALMPEPWRLLSSFTVLGGVSLYAALFRIPWNKVAESMNEYRASGEMAMIVPDEARYWCYYAYAGSFMFLTGGLWYLIFPPVTFGDFVLTASMFLFSILLMFGSPLSGSVERTLLVYKALFAVAGLGFLIDGTHSFVVEDSLLSGLFALLGLFLLYHAFVRMSWTFMREVVEEYRAVEHPSTLGIERITERVQERWDETEAS